MNISEIRLNLQDYIQFLYFSGERDTAKPDAAAVFFLENK